MLPIGAALLIDSRWSQWTIGPPALEIWWSCQISGGPDVANCIFFWQNQTQLTEFTFSHTRLIYENTLQYIHFIEKDDIGKKKYLCTFSKCYKNSVF